MNAKVVGGWGKEQKPVRMSYLYVQFKSFINGRKRKFGREREVQREGRRDRERESDLMMFVLICGPR